MRKLLDRPIDTSLAVFVVVAWAFAIVGVGHIAQHFGYPAWWQFHG